MDQPLDIGSRRELFVDEFLIDTIEGAALRLQEPRPGGVAIAYDRPLGELHRLLYDGAEGRRRLPHVL